jgi:hypothetical protein
MMTRHAQGHLRATDADRDAIAERLASAMSEGRLAADEYDQRLGQAFAAKTYADLGRLVADLPVSAHQGAPASPPTGPKRASPLPVVRANAGFIGGLPIGCLIVAVVLIVMFLA